MAIHSKNGEYYSFDSKTKELEWLCELTEVSHFDKYHTYSIYEIDGKFYSRTLVKLLEREMPNLTLDETYTEIPCVMDKFGCDFEKLEEKKDELVEMTIFDFL